MTIMSKCQYLDVKRKEEKSDLNDGSEVPKLSDISCARPRDKLVFFPSATVDRPTAEKNFFQQLPLESEKEKVCP